MLDEPTNAKLVLLPGMDGTGLLFEPLLKHLNADLQIQVIRYPTDKLLSYDALVEYVRARLPTEPFALLAESFSGPIGYRLALDKGVAIRRVIFAASFVSNPNPKLLKLASFLPLSQLLKIPPPQFLLRFLYATKKRKRKIEVSELELIRQATSMVRPNVMAYRLRLMSKLSHPRLPLNKPCLTLNALDDRLVSARASQLLETCCTNAIQTSLVTSHFLLQSDPEHAAQEINKFLDE